jgi:predicted secreted Zn-dependent protease
MLAVVFLGMVGVADAPDSKETGVRVSEQVEYYDIGGASVTALWQNISARGPRMNAGAWAGHARWDVHWTYEWREAPEGCLIENAGTELAIIYTLPRWLGRDMADDDLREKWDRFSMALRAHEEGHGTNGRRAALRINAALRGLQPRDTCEALISAADDTARRIIDEEAGNDRLYDESTRHGLMQGVVLR